MKRVFMIQIQPVSTIKNELSEIESKLDEADNEAKNTSKRLTHDEVFNDVREKLK